jgi:hypothetical protein
VTSSSFHCYLKEPFRQFSKERSNFTIPLLDINPFNKVDDTPASYLIIPVSNTGPGSVLVSPGKCQDRTLN